LINPKAENSDAKKDYIFSKASSWVIYK